MSQDLSKFYRIPKININLPCSTDFYPTDSIDLSIDGSIKVHQMTSRDEMILKTPDSLLNGDSILHVIQSCVPAIKNPKKILAPDIDAILLGIFYASYGPNLDFHSKCPKCDHEEDYQQDIRALLDRQNTLRYPQTVTHESGSDCKLVSYIRPYSFETNTRQQLTLFEQSKLMQALEKSNLTEQEQIAQASDCLKKMINIKFDNVKDCIDKIEVHTLVNGEWIKNTVDNPESIHEFIFNADKDIMDPIIEAIDKLNKHGVPNEINIMCNKCSHEYSSPMEFNPSSFFVRNSKTPKVTTK